MAKKKDLVGRRFGMLTVLENDGTRRGYAVCQCDCGKVLEVQRGHLLSGNTKSCKKGGCKGVHEENVQTASVPTEEEQLEEMLNTPFENRRRIHNINVLYNKAYELSKVPRKSKRNSSGVVGVSWNKKTRKWTVKIGFRGENINLGSYPLFNDAVKERMKAEEMLFAPAILSKEKFHKNTYKCIDTKIGA